jgi:hypothetical protein
MTTALEGGATTFPSVRGRCVIPETGVASRNKCRWAFRPEPCRAVAVLRLGTDAVLHVVVEITTDSRAMSSCTIELRTPIDGVGRESIRRVGDRVNRGGLVAGVSNSRMDHPRPVNLRAQPRQLRADAAAIAA